MTYKQIYLKRGKDESLRRFHPWVFSGAIQRFDDGIEEGETVEVLTADGEFIAVGHFQLGSIAVRVLSFRRISIDDEFWASRLSSALQMRQAIGLCDNASNDSYRLVHGEGDHLPGLIIDVYGQTAVMQAHSIGMHLARHAIASQLLNVMQGRIANVYYKSETTLPYMEPENGFLYGESTDNTALENGLRFQVDWLRGQKTGFFIDQRENRALVQQLAFNHRLLNCFGYTGGFSLAALKGGADYVETVDISKKAIDLCNRNVEMNFPGCSNHTGTVADVLQYIQTIKQSDNQAFDFIILDPPAFAKNHRTLQQGLKGYRAINQRAMEKIAPGGLLMTFSCSLAVSKEDFQTMVFTAAMNAHRRVRIVRQLPHAMDHPVSIHHPEGEYLKGLLLEVE